MAALWTWAGSPAITWGVIVELQAAAHSGQALKPETAMSHILLLLVFLAFGAYSAYVVYDVGYVGILHSHLTNAGGIQVLCDLTISLSLVCIWIVADARKQSRNPWPYLVATLFLGSFGPLLYLLLRPGEGRKVGKISAAVADAITHLG
jgi:hypothetical protein